MLYIMSIASYEKYILVLATVLSNNISDTKYADVSALANNTYKSGDIFMIQGKLSNVTKANVGDISYTKSADLVDKTGARDVLIFQNAFTDSELLDERIHYMFYDNNLSSYVVLYSIKKTPDIVN